MPRQLGPYRTPPSTGRVQRPRPYRPTRSSWRHVASRLAQAAMPYALSAAERAGNQAAQALADYGQGAPRGPFGSRLPRPQRAKTVGRARKASRGGSYLPGHYSGKFKKASKGGMMKKITKYARSGFVTTQEITGSINDNDCVYMGHSAIDPDKSVLIIIQSLMRKLMKKGYGYNVTNVGEYFPADIVGTDTRFRLVKKNLLTGAEIIVQHSGLSIESVAPLFLNDFIDYSNGGPTDSLESVLDLVKFEVYARDAIDATIGNSEYRLRAQINLKNEVVHFFSKSEMKIQNRSKAADGSADAENIAANPLVGRLYEMKGGVPRARVFDVSILEKIRVNGVLLVRSAEFTPGVTGTVTGSTMKEPPIPKVFQNCSKSAKVRLEPGAIKTHYCNVTYSKPLLYFLKKIHVHNSTTSGGLQTTYTIGKFALFALEDVINVNVNSKIECAYEINRQFGAYLTTMKPAVAQGQYVQETVSNVISP